MTYPFVASRYDLGPRSGPILGFVIHMAEGGGTVGYLAGSPARGVSVHYVIESSGRIVQMLREDHLHGSINPGALRTDDDKSGPFGMTAAVDVLGGWYMNPNNATIAVEIEGYASAGPDVDQLNALARLVADVRSRHPAIGLLGHRDFQSYKPCPGRWIPWDELGGHGAHQEEPMQSFSIDPKAVAGTVTVSEAGHWYVALADGKLHGPVIPATFGEHRAFGPVTPVPAIPGHDGEPAYLIGTLGALILVADATFTPDPSPDVDAILEAAAIRAAAAVRTP